jgi:hypothetical protein
LARSRDGGKENPLPGFSFGWGHGKSWPLDASEGALQMEAHSMRLRLGSAGCPNPPDCNWGDIKPEIESATTFDQWYRTVDGVNVEIQKTLPLTETPPASGEYAFDSALVDSAGFFPLSPEEGLGSSPLSDRNSGGKNFLFTTEIHVKFGVAGNTYTMDVFHAERQTTGSNFKITKNIKCFTPVPIVK